MKELFEFSLYLLYGLIFVVIGFTIFFRDFRFSNLSIASALPTLAVFGFIHGLHEWSEMYLFVYKQELSMHTTVKLFKVFKLWLSFLALGYFAIQMLSMTKWRLRKQLLVVAELVSVVFLFSVIYRYFHQDLNDFVRDTTLQTRWLFGSCAGILAGASLMNYSQKLKLEERKAASAVGRLGICIIIYGLSAGIFYIEDLTIGASIRTAIAFMIWLYLRQTLKLFEDERQLQIEGAIRQFHHDSKLRELGELSSSITHEIKTPLSSALMRCDLLEKQIDQDDVDREKMKRQLSYIRKGVLKAAHISQELLQFSHKRNAIKQKVSMDELVNEALNLMEHRLHYFDIQKNIMPNLFFYADKEQLEEVLINLINNAIDASEENKKIVIKAEQKGLRVILSVIDFGTGIDEAILEKVTLPFFTTKDKHHGTGLGLTLCQKIVDQNGGSLLIENTGTGLCVSIELPMESQ
jgi:signal transduction histidine kinase